MHKLNSRIWPHDWGISLSLSAFLCNILSLSPVCVSLAVLFSVYVFVSGLPLNLQGVLELLGILGRSIFRWCHVPLPNFFHSMLFSRPKSVTQFQCCKILPFATCTFTKKLKGIQWKFHGYFMWQHNKQQLLEQKVRHLILVKSARNFFRVNFAALDCRSFLCLRKWRLVNPLHCILRT